MVMGYTKDEIPDYQMAAFFLMAVYFKGMDKKRDCIFDKGNERVR